MHWKCQSRPSSGVGACFIFDSASKSSSTSFFLNCGCTRTHSRSFCSVSREAPETQLNEPEPLMSMCTWHAQPCVLCTWQCDTEGTERATSVSSQQVVMPQSRPEPLGSGDITWLRCSQMGM
jgi:hypothetical protein